MNEGQPTIDERGTSGMSMMMQSLDTEMLIWKLGNIQARLANASEEVKSIHSHLCERRRWAQSMTTETRHDCVLHTKTDNAEWWQEFQTEEQRRRYIVESRIWAHYDHAREKHPHFCDRLTNPHVDQIIDDLLTVDRKGLKMEIEEGEETANTILSCEKLEMLAAIAHGDTANAIEEAYDCIAVLLRVIDVLEGRQKLGKPEGQPEVVKCDHGPKVRLVSVEQNYRPATEDDVKNGKAAWCYACLSACINHGKDALVVCDGYVDAFGPCVKPEDKPCK